jgi:hypothetical protein
LIHDLKVFHERAFIAEEIHDPEDAMKELEDIVRHASQSFGRSDSHMAEEAPPGREQDRA